MNAISTGQAMKVGQGAALASGWTRPFETPFRRVSTPNQSRAQERRQKLGNASLGPISWEQVSMVLLAVVAIVGIAYGFSRMIDLVQNWAVFERGVANLI